MRIKHMLCCGAALALPATAANALVITLVDQGGVTGSAAESGFRIAADYWESVLTNDITITFGVSYASLGSGR